jgi:hypothetical protein
LTITTHDGTATLHFGETSTTDERDDEVESWLSKQKRH